MIFIYILWSSVSVNEGEFLLFFTMLHSIQTLGLNVNVFLHIGFLPAH